MVWHKGGITTLVCCLCCSHVLNGYSPLFAVGNDAQVVTECNVDVAGSCQQEEEQEEEGHEAKRQEEETDSKCTLYLAESTIPGAGVGVFSGINVHKDELVGGPSGGELVIPLIYMDWYNDDAAGTGYNGFIGDDYTWESFVLGSMVHECSNERECKGFCPGVGAAVNCIMALINIEEGTPQADTVGLHRSTNPGVGAFTPYHNRTTIAIADIPAGAELFADYGDHWFRERTEHVGLVPLSENYDEAEFLIENFVDIITKHRQRITPDMKKDLWDFIAQFPIKSRTINAIPSSIEEAMHLVEVGTMKFLLPNSTRSLEWLQEHGMCMDNIHPGNSTVAEAGRGAFATRFIPRGGLVAPSPLLHVADRNIFNIYKDIVHEDGSWEKDTSIIVGYQLLLNYCFGHRKTTMLLCPYGAMTGFINHNRHSPNAKVRWAKYGVLNHRAEWLNKTVEELGHVFSPGLMFEYVATRDIQKGEEVFIDYGREWEEAWTNHIRNWVPTEGSDTYISASDLNRDTNTPIRTQSEELTDPYPDNVMIQCHKILVTHSRAWRISRFRTQLDGITNRKEQLYSCTITKREVINGEYLYSGEIQAKTSSALSQHPIRGREGGKRNREFTVEFNRVPRDAIVFVDLPYTSDQFLPNAFRHEMMIPDEMFPQAWENL